MRYEMTTDIMKPLEQVAKLFVDRNSFKHWQKELVAIRSLDGELNATGSQYEVEVRMGKHNLTMVETILDNSLPRYYKTEYRTGRDVNTLEFWFAEVSPQSTQLKVECVFICHSFLMKIMAFFMPGSFKKQTKQYLDAFKEFAERSA